MYGFQLQVASKTLKKYNEEAEKPLKPKDVAIVLRASSDTRVNDTFKALIDLPVLFHVDWSKENEPILLHDEDLEMTWGECQKLQRFKRGETSGDLKVIFVGLRESELPLERKLLIEAIRRVKNSKFYRERRQLEKALIDIFGNDEEDSSATHVSSKKRKAEPRSPKNRKHPKPSPAYTDIPPPHERMRFEYNGLPLWLSSDKRNKTGYKGVAPQKLNGLFTGKFFARWVGGGDQYQIATAPTALKAAYAYAINMLIEHNQTFKPVSFTEHETQKFAKDLIEMKRYKNLR